jgi:hypothetical protein
MWKFIGHNIEKGFWFVAKVQLSLVVIDLLYQFRDYTYNLLK